LLLRKGESEKAIEPLRESIRLAPKRPHGHYNLALALQAVGQPEEAIAAYREAIRLQPEYAEAHGNLGVRLARKGLDDEAIACYREAVRLKPELHTAHFNLGRALVRKGAFAEAERPFHEAHELRSKTLGAAHGSTLLALDERISVHLAQDKQLLAEPLLRERLTMSEEKEPTTLKQFDTMIKLGACLAVQRKFDEAELLLLGGYEGLKMQMEVSGPLVVEALERLVQLYESWGKNDKANEWRKQFEAHKQEQVVNAGK